MNIRIGLLMVAPLAFPMATIGQCTSNQTQGKAPVLSLNISALQQTVRTGNAVIVKATMTNKSSHDVSIWMEIGAGRQFHIEVRDSTGNLVPDTEEGKKRNGHVDPSQLQPRDWNGSGACLTLKPGETSDQQVTVSTLYDMNRPGTYSIQLQKPDPETLAPDKSNTVTVTVTP